jgi:hypothetical protein
VKSKRNPHYPRIRLMTLICLLLSLMATTTASASSSTSFASVGPVSSDLTTPALIEQAFRNNQITADQRLLYLTYAVYDFAKLPPQFQGKGGWRGTMIVYEINQARRQLREGKGQFSPALREALLAPQPQASTFCDREDGPNTISTEHFQISYGSINELTVQEYAQTLEYAYKVEVEQFGWAKPPLVPNNPFNKYPVQIVDLGDQVYGYVSTDGGNYKGFIGDNPNTPEVETRSFASCMVLNSDMLQFADGDVDKASLALTATAGHEFFHAIQAGYGDPGSPEENVWYESTAAYVEDVVSLYAHINYDYLFPDLSYSLPTPKPVENAEYSLWPLFSYAAEQHGGILQPSGGELMKLMWRDIAAGLPAMTAYDNALKAKGSNLNYTYHNFAISLRFLKPCPDPVPPFCFPDGHIIRDLVGTLDTTHGQIASVGGSYNGSMSNNYATNWVALPKSGTYSIELTNTSSTGALRASVVAEVGDSLTVASLASVAGPNATTSIARFSVPSGATNVLLVITNEAQSSNIESPGTATYRVQLGTAMNLDHSLYLPLSLR